MKLTRNLPLVVMALLAVAACTNKTAVEQQAVRIKTPTGTPSQMTFVDDVTINGTGITILQMQRRGGSLYVTGFGGPNGIGIARWDIASNPIRPAKIWSIADGNALNFPSYTQDAYSSGAVAAYDGSAGQFVYSSGTAGAIVSNGTNTSSPFLALRKPGLAANGGIQQDAAYVWRAIVLSPFLPVGLGFGQSNGVYSFNMNTLTNFQYNSYSSNGTVCCVKNAEEFIGNAFIAFGGMLVYLPFTNNPNAPYGAVSVLNDIQAQLVAVSNTHLFVLHIQSSEYPAGLPYPSGLYRFNTSGENDRYYQLPANFSARAMAASQSGRYLYVSAPSKVDIYELVDGSNP